MYTLGLFKRWCWERHIEKIFDMGTHTFFSNPYDMFSDNITQTTKFDDGIQLI